MDTPDFGIMHTRPTLVVENEVCQFWMTDMTNGASDWAQKKRGIKDLICLLAVQKKDADRYFVLLDTKTNQILHASKSFEDIACKIDKIAIGEGRKALT
jgi:hypothetical protein